MKFEDTAIDYYGEGDRTHRNLTHPAAGDMKTKIVDSVSSWKNPYKDGYIWIKGELLDTKGMIDAMNGRDECIRSMNKAEDSKRSK